MAQSEAEKLALALFTGSVKAMPQFAVDPQIEDSIMFQPSQEDVIEPAMFGNLDDIPVGAIGKGLLGLALMAGIKPVGKAAAAYLPEAVKMAEKRIVEPIIESAVSRSLGDDAVEVAIGEAQLADLLSSDWYHGTGVRGWGALDPALAGSATRADDAKAAWWFAQNPKLADKFTWKGGEKVGEVKRAALPFENPYISDAIWKMRNSAALTKDINDAAALGADVVIFPNAESFLGEGGAVAAVPLAAGSKVKFLP